ncbi:MAG TPA: type III pantothenate kinase, partial [Candidatus Thioglobus sp.]|nr:type III pantothenate kinase [Candidatus Thioglobus sp.]
SAVTFDVLLSSGLHSGGLIMPGLSALRSSFDKFSTNDQSEQAAPVASSTKDAWMSGTNLMLINAIKLQIDGYKDMYADSTIIFTGGGAQKVLRHLNGNHKYHENLVLYGLSIYAESIIKKL